MPFVLNREAGGGVMVNYNFGVEIVVQEQSPVAKAAN